MVHIDEEFYMNFEIIKRLGDGANSEVYLVKEYETGNTFASKILDNDTFDFQEIRIWDMMKGDEHILNYFSIFKTRNNTCILMEVVDGYDLYQMIQKNPSAMREEKVVELFRQLMIAVSTMHKKEICHLDIKHENIMFDKKDKKLKLIDFDSCQVGEMVRSIKGTMHFLPPERINEHDAFNGFKADIWACGVVLFEMYTRNFPFSHDDDDNYYYSMVKRIMRADYIKEYYQNEEFAINRKKIDLFSDLISKIFKVNPDERISVEDILSHPFLN